MACAGGVALVGDLHALAGAEDGRQVHAFELVGVDAALVDENHVTHLCAVGCHGVGHADELGEHFHQSFSAVLLEHLPNHDSAQVQAMLANACNEHRIVG